MKRLNEEDEELWTFESQLIEMRILIANHMDLLTIILFSRASKESYKFLVEHIDLFGLALRSIGSYGSFAGFKLHNCAFPCLWSGAPYVALYTIHDVVLHWYDNLYKKRLVCGGFSSHEDVVDFNKNALSIIKFVNFELVYMKHAIPYEYEHFYSDESNLDERIKNRLCARVGDDKYSPFSVMVCYDTKTCGIIYTKTFGTRGKQICMPKDKEHAIRTKRANESILLVCSEELHTQLKLSTHLTLEGKQMIHEGITRWLRLQRMIRHNFQVVEVHILQRRIHQFKKKYDIPDPKESLWSNPKQPKSLIPPK